MIQYVTKLYPQTLEVTQPLKGSRITIPKSSQRIARKKSSNYLTYQTANAPENGWLEDDFPFRETLFFRVLWLVFGRVINRWASREVKSISFCAESESEWFLVESMGFCGLNRFDATWRIVMFFLGGDTWRILGAITPVTHLFFGHL